MAAFLIIVSPKKPTLYTYLAQVFGNDTGGLILDRRMAERRQRQDRAAADRRHGDRRQHDIAADLQTFGWALVRR